MLVVCLLQESACESESTFVGAVERALRHRRNEGGLLTQGGKQGTAQIAREVLADPALAKDGVV